MSELENLSLEERKKLEDRTVRGNPRRKPGHEGIKKRTNKNRPIEMSSKIRVRTEPKPQAKGRDPRFDSLCGDFEATAFAQNYSFIDEIQEKEKKLFARSARKEKNPEKKAEMKKLLRSQQDRDRELKRRQKEAEIIQKNKAEVAAALQAGKPARIRTRGEQKMDLLIHQYSELKKRGKLAKYMSAKAKKIQRKNYDVPSGWDPKQRT